MITIRFAEDKDLDTLRNFDLHSKYISRERISAKISQNEIIVAEDEVNIVGMLRFTYIWSTRPYVELIYINEAYRKQGISKQLLDFLIDYLVKEGYSYVFSSSEEDEKEAQDWHNHMGFEEIGKLTGLNLPHDITSEVFFSKKIADTNSLRKYPL